jgi:alanine racemase
VNSWIEVSEERLAGNYGTIVKAAGAETDVLAVVKANAYGHGTVRCAVILAQAGARWVGVAGVDEGVRVKGALGEVGFGDDAPRILVICGFLPENVAAIVEHALTPVVWTVEQVGWLAGTGLRVHVEVETGMGRQGVRVGTDLDRLLTAVKRAGIVVDGVCTHFCGAEMADSELTQGQRRRFEAAIAQVREHGLRPKWVHAGSSSSVDNPPEGAGWLADLAKTLGARAMVRCGIGLYGYCLPIQGSGQPKIRPALKPVMTWKTRVIDVNDMSDGETIGYNATFTAPGPMRLALLPVGYADGLRRALSSTNARAGGWVTIGGVRSAIVGRVSMNLTMVDVTGIEGVGVGDEVVLLGDGVTADDHARLAGTISYEILCGVRAG